jgi:uncharacterized oxidoreductase
MKLSGNTVLVTGGATGIGLSMALQFLKNGSKVIICGRRKERLIEAQEKYPGLEIKTADVAKRSERIGLSEWVISNFKEVNVLVNNAGIQRTIDLAKGSSAIEEGEDEITINLVAPIMLSALFIPHLIKQKNAAIINVSSGLGFVPMAQFPVYCATKAAIHSYSMSLRHQLKNKGVAVIEIIPPAVDTELNTSGGTRPKRSFGLSADEFVSKVMKDIEADTEEIGYGFTRDFIRASRDELDKRFAAMNSY